MDIPWKSQKKSFEDALIYLKGRKEGAITSIKTPWQKLNIATINGFEWHNTIVIAGRPAAGKTAVKAQFIREVFKLNPTTPMRVLEFSLEMVGRASAIRDMSSITGKSYRDLCSAGEEDLSVEDFNKCVDYAKEVIKYPIDIVEEVDSVVQFEEIIENYMEKHSFYKPEKNKTTGITTNKKEFTKTIISLDHSILINEKNKIDMLYNLGATLTKLKRKYPIIFVILSQLNRNIDHPERNEDGKYGNYILESDIFGSDAMLQHAD